ncbi:YhcN/YlaJ family sporulation lipoprotein [Fictibacillus gelatini]|uniref:YhcN/YlaJ family sporulation lipoprotein n=1 Tax=Fictibacillus gelatini TaxID=225985 RepID=UPI00042A08E5|nr:YhcN/YlaJ family sporulation lipoprotein [Fictibacillus gelatini]
MRKNYLYTLFFVFSLIGGISGCTDQNKEQLKTSNIHVSSTSQKPSNTAKEAIKNMEEVQAVKAVNSDKEVYVAVKVDHFDRFRLKKLLKTIKSKVQKQVRGKEVYVSADKKIYMLLSDLENLIRTKNPGEKTIESKLKVIKSEMNSDI